jgi:hypothetical protein
LCPRPFTTQSPCESRGWNFRFGVASSMGRAGLGTKRERLAERGTAGSKCATTSELTRRRPVASAATDPSPSISNVAIVPETRRYRPSAVAFQGASPIKLAELGCRRGATLWHSPEGYLQMRALLGVLVHTAMSPISRILAVARFGENSRLPFLAPNCLASSARVFKKLLIPLSKILVNGRFCVVH